MSNALAEQRDVPAVTGGRRRPRDVHCGGQRSPPKTLKTDLLHGAKIASAVLRII
jgi:hypothetical protein